MAKFQNTSTILTKTTLSFSSYCYKKWFSAATVLSTMGVALTQKFAIDANGAKVRDDDKFTIGCFFIASAIFMLIYSLVLYVDSLIEHPRMIFTQSDSH